MGRQIVFHMLPEDCEAFVGFIQERKTVFLAPFVADSPEVHVLADRRDAYGQWLCLWDQELLPTLQRNHVREVSPTHRIKDSLPVLQLDTHRPAEWGGRPALTQGRLYSHSYQSLPAVRAWFEALARWIRKRFVKNPASWMGGCVGPEAYAWHKAGGLLLPYVSPPASSEWVNRIFEQHRSD